MEIDLQKLGRLRDAVLELQRGLDLIRDEVASRTDWSDTQKKNYIELRDRHLQEILERWLEGLKTLIDADARTREVANLKQLVGSMRGVGKMLDDDFHWSHYRKVIDSAATKINRLAADLYGEISS